MSRSTILRTGAVAFRTTLLTEARAESFARMLAGNARFEDIEVQESSRAKSERAFFVTFSPSSAARKDLIFMAQWDSRRTKGEGEGADYTFWPDDDNAGCFWVFNPISGETYTTSIFSCSCPDYLYRASRAGCLCKHQHSLSAHLKCLNEQKAA